MPTCCTRWRDCATTPTSLARVANTCGEASQQSIDEMTGIAREVWEAVKAGW